MTARGWLLLVVGATVTVVPLRPPADVEPEELTWVFFTDKGEPESSHLSPASLERRR